MKKLIHKNNEEKFIDESQLNDFLLNGWELGFSDNHRKNIKESHKGKQSNTKGLIKITNGVEEKCINSSDLQKYVQSGWYRGVKPRPCFSEDSKLKMSISHKGKKLSLEHKENIGNALKGRQRTEQERKNISLGKKGKPNGFLGKHHTKEWNENISKAHKTKECLKKEYITKKKNNSFNSSKHEETIYDVLCKKYGKENIKRNYVDEIRYPFRCDFYIVSEDLFIEVNMHWTHGFQRYDESSQTCIEQYNKWQEKAKNSQFYKNAIHTWTIRDVNKINYAKKNNLKYITIYKEEDLWEIK